MFFTQKHPQNLLILERQCLLEGLKQTKTDLDTALQNFENATDPDLIDCYIYEVNAAQKRYEFLISRVKALYKETA